MQKTTTDSVESNQIPHLYQIVEKREYWVSIGDKRYKYLLDAALYKDARYLWNRSRWKGLNFLKRNAIQWEEV